MSRPLDRLSVLAFAVLATAGLLVALFVPRRRVWVKVAAQGHTLRIEYAGLARGEDPTLDGAVELAIPAGTSSGRTFRLKGKGFPAKDGAGDLMATVKIVLPEGSDKELEELMKTWREGKPYDPRRG